NRFAGQVVKADMMHDSGEYAYTENDLCQAVQLPYAGNRLAMLVLLPKLHPMQDYRTSDGVRGAMDQLEGALDNGYVQKLTRQLAERRLNLTLPKWQATQASDLGPTLAELGMKLAFSATADFSGINGQKGLFLSEVVHKAFVSVDEVGTEAAAATGGVASTGIPQPPMDFTADHPFVYLIIDKPSHPILFA